MERTFVMVKPDGVQRNLVGEIIGRFEAKGLRLAGVKMVHITEELAGRHYEAHQDKPFFGELVEFITSGPVVAMVLEGDNAVGVARTLMGATNPQQAAPGTTRGDFGLTIGKNVIHGSDALESAEREISLFFNDNEIIDYAKKIEDWVY